MFPLSEKRAVTLVILVATGLALVSLRPYAASWNDGSRLATVECLVDQSTFAIDNSVFVAVPTGGAGAGNPYRGPALEKGTYDKLWINGHFYSDKSPVPALLLAAIYQIMQWVFGLNVLSNPEAFCWWMAAVSSGVAYVVAVVCIFRLGKVVRLTMPWRLMLTASFGLSTVALAYVQHVNNHILLLAVASALMLQIAQLANTSPRWRLLLLGALAGFGYAIDLGAGPPLCALGGLLVLWQCKPRLASCVLFTAAASPWLVLHHAVNYAIGGTFGPANAVPEFFNWDGCPFHGKSMTGTWHHESVWDFIVYALALVFGKRGFVGHNLALFLLLPGILLLARRLSNFQSPKSEVNTLRKGYWTTEFRPRTALPALLFAATWSGAVWLIYAATSRNYSGANLSIRWFVPLLAPGYYALGVVLAQRPGWRPGFLVLSAWGAVLMALAWWRGPWDAHVVPGFWLIQAAALVNWAWLSWRQAKKRPGPPRLAFNPRPFLTMGRPVTVEGD